MGGAARSGWFVLIAGLSCAGAVAASCTSTGDGVSASAKQDHDGSLVEASVDATSTDSNEAATGEEASADTSSPSPEPGLDGGAESAADAGTTCLKLSPADPCGLDPQCGCSSLETCDADGGGGTICVTAGTAASGHGCTTSASCAPGLTCYNGACRPYCTNTGDAGCAAKLPEGGACTSVPGADGGPIRGYDVCTIRCDLEDPQACGATGDLYGGCLPDGNGGTDCIGVGLSTLGEECSYLNDCKPGLVCVGQCARWCRVGHSPTDCGDAAACVEFNEPVIAYGVRYGYCP